MKDLSESKQAQSPPQSFLAHSWTTPASNRLVYILAGIILIAIAAIYWPVLHGNFVWDDWQSFRDKPWLTQGDNWKQYIFHDFNWWVYYFRPLVLAFFTLQVRLFDSTPGPMHGVSLALHLINVALVGKLSWQVAGLAGKQPQARTWATALCMVLYGLHPALIESLAWIGCQFDLITTLLTLLGLIANIGIQRQPVRAAILTTLFFLAACSKESAMSFPLLIALFDWLIVSRAQRSAFIPTLRSVIRRNWIAYAGMLAAGFAYLFFRHWALGSVLNGLEGYSISPFARLQVIGYIYFHYWKIMLWPVAELSPLHPFDIQTFNTLTTDSLAMTMVSLTIVAAGLYTGLKRTSPLGCIVLAITAALLPVLQVIPGHFERSLYHARYATTALAIACAMLPLLRVPASIQRQSARSTLFLVSIGALFLWLSFSIVDIRTILPLWSNDVRLWGWALSVSPESTEAKEYLLLAYVRSKDFNAATAYADSLLETPSDCTTCVISVAELALANDDLPRARLAIRGLEHSPALWQDKKKRQTYYQLDGELLFQENKWDDAEKVARSAMAMDPTDQKSKDLLAKIEALRKGAEPGH